MPEGFLHLFAARPLLEIVRDLFDIIIVAYITYRALLVLRGTRAMQMGIGLAIVALIYVAAKYLKLVTLVSLLSWLLSSIILIVVVIFQNDIRRALIRMGGKALFSGGREQQSRVIDEVVAAATELARHRMGAIIAFEQDANVLEFAKSEGIIIDSVVTRELLVSLFIPESVNKLHDGAVLIRDLKIARAGMFFPMPETKILDASLGSRHRASLGITEETDAVVVVVSEERGTISFCFSGNIVSNLDGQSLRHALLGLFGRTPRKRQFNRKAPGTGSGTGTGAPSGRTSLPGPAPRPTAATSGERSAPASIPPPPAKSMGQSPPGTPPAGKVITSPMKMSEPVADRLSTLPTGRHPLVELPPSSTPTPMTTSTPMATTPTPKGPTFVPPSAGSPTSSGSGASSEPRGGRSPGDDS